MTEFQAALLEENIRGCSRGRCALCRRRATSALVWTPDPRHHARLEVPAGKDRVYTVPVCSRHAGPENVTRIEEMILGGEATG